jgi:hypothetical protein
MHEALCRSSGTTLDSVHAEDGPPITQRTSGLKLRELAAWYRKFAECAGNPVIWESRVLLAEDLEREARIEFELKPQRVNR